MELKLYNVNLDMAIRYFLFVEKMKTKNPIQVHHRILAHTSDFEKGCSVASNCSGAVALALGLFWPGDYPDHPDCVLGLLSKRLGPACTYFELPSGLETQAAVQTLLALPSRCAQVA